MHCMHGVFPAGGCEENIAVLALGISRRMRRSVASEQCDLSGLQTSLGVDPYDSKNSSPNSKNAGLSKYLLLVLFTTILSIQTLLGQDTNNQPLPPAIDSLPALGVFLLDGLAFPLSVSAS